MAITTSRCPVSHEPVTVITDLEGRVARVICPQLEEGGYTCRLKQEADTGGQLSQLLTRLSEDTLGERGTRCRLL